jgi:hypothetical protein
MSDRDSFDREFGMTSASPPRGSDGCRQEAPFKVTIEAVRGGREKLDCVTLNRASRPQRVHLYDYGYAVSSIFIEVFGGEHSPHKAAIEALRI